MPMDGLSAPGQETVSRENSEGLERWGMQEQKGMIGEMRISPGDSRR
jgi:hypothetical protein